MKTEPNPSQTPKKPGLFARLIEKLDENLKRKAREKSDQGGCCGGKGGKCC